MSVRRVHQILWGDLAWVPCVSLARVEIVYSSANLKSKQGAKKNFACELALILRSEDHVARREMYT